MGRGAHILGLGDEEHIFIFLREGGLHGKDQFKTSSKGQARMFDLKDWYSAVRLRPRMGLCFAVMSSFVRWVGVYEGRGQTEEGGKLFKTFL